MKEPISIDKDKILAIVRDRKSQKIAVATVATATALIFSTVNLPVLKSHEEPAMKSMSIAAPHQVKSVDDTSKLMNDEETKDADKKEDKKEDKKDKKEDKKEEPKKEESKKEDKKEETKKEDTKKEDKKEESKKSESNSSASRQSSQQSSNNQSSTKSNASQPQVSEPSKPSENSGSSIGAITPKIEIPKSKPRVNADEMNRNDKPSNWDGSKEVDEASVEDQWNDDESIDEVEAR